MTVLSIARLSQPPSGGIHPAPTLLWQKAGAMERHMKAMHVRCAIAAAAVVALLVSTRVGAQCTVTADGDPASVKLAQSLVANSDSLTVRAAYASHRCNIRKLMHGGGRPCRFGMPLDHVTIRVWGVATYHVFPAHLADGHFCTTP